WFLASSAEKNVAISCRAGRVITARFCDSFGAGWKCSQHPRDMEVSMWVDELYLEDPGQDGPAWTWTKAGFSPEEAEHMRRKFAQDLLKLQKQFCLSGDPVFASRVKTLCLIYHTHEPPWAECVLSRLAWSAMMAPTVIQGRRLRQTHWIRYAAVRDHIRQQREAGVKRVNRELAYREVSAALRGQPGRGAPSRIGASYLKVAAAVRRGEVDQYALGSF